MKFSETKLGRRIARMDGSWRGRVHGKKGLTESRYSLRARQIVNKKMPGGLRWQRWKDLGAE